MKWVWGSMNPGNTVLPPQSMTRVALPAHWRTSSLLPTYRIRSPFKATASAMGWASSTVITVPLTRIVSA